MVAARIVLRRSVNLYASGKVADALDYTLHAIVQSVEARDTLLLSGILLAINERIEELSTARDSKGLPREVDLWIGALLMTRGLARESLPIRETVLSSVRDFVTARLEKGEAARLLRGLT
ncbi:MAG TPA: hypothetical protein VGU66_15455 [Candidatus Elarobacter sp.]|nr:hypothetical protein [Candidatus Elarobacter sp.]